MIARVQAAQNARRRQVEHKQLQWDTKRLIVLPFVVQAGRVGPTPVPLQKLGPKII